MGTTHRLYELKEKDVSIHEIVKDMLKIYDSLCIGEDRTFFHQFSFDNLADLEEVQSKFEIRTHDMFSSFKLDQPNKLIETIENTWLYDTISLSNRIGDEAKREYLHYWMTINPDGFKVTIVLPITEGLNEIKEVLKSIFIYLAENKVIELDKIESTHLAENLTDSEIIKNEGYTYTKRGVEYFAWGDTWTRGSLQVRPSSIRLKFDESYMSRHGGVQNATIQFYKVMNRYKEFAHSKIEGMLRSKFNPSAFEVLGKLDFLNPKVSISLDLNKNQHFTAQDLRLTSKPKSSFTIDNFDWKDSEPNHLDNRIYLAIYSMESWYMQINISKQINEEYYFNIELLINKELEYLGME